MQPSGPAQAFKSLGVAKRYCRMDSIGDTFMQRDHDLSQVVNTVGPPRYLGKTHIPLPDCKIEHLGKGPNRKFTPTSNTPIFV